MEILYVDDELLVVNKDAGMAAVPGGWEAGGPSLAGALEAEYGRVWIVHRLDRVTSGVIVFARSAAAHRTLSQMFESRDVHKTYHALVCGVPGWEQYACRLPLLADVGHRHRTVVNQKRGQAALTRFRLLRGALDAALVEASPETGRTHQIRAHLSALDFPILGDTLYGAPSSDLIARPALHAYSLVFEYSGKIRRFTAPYPQDFRQALDKLEKGK